MENGNNLMHSFNATEYSQGHFLGLTKREYFAGLAMQGMLSDPNASNFKPPFIAELAVDFSDALLKELDKK